MAEGGDPLPWPRQVSTNQDLAQVLAGAVPTAFHELEVESAPSVFVSLLDSFQLAPRDQAKLDFELYLNEAVDNWTPFRDGVSTNPFLQAFETRTPTPLPDLNEGNPLVLATTFRTHIPRILDEIYTDPGVVKAVTSADVPPELRLRALEVIVKLHGLRSRGSLCYRKIYCCLHVIQLPYWGYSTLLLIWMISLIYYG